MLCARTKIFFVAAFLAACLCSAEAARRYTPGHYVMIPPHTRERAGGVPNADKISAAGPVAPGVTGLVIRYHWKEVDNDDGTTEKGFRVFTMEGETFQHEFIAVS